MVNLDMLPETTSDSGVAPNTSNWKLTISDPCTTDRR